MKFGPAAVAAVLRKWDHPIDLARTPLRRTYPDVPGYVAGSRVRSLLVNAMREVIDQTTGCQDADSVRVHTYLIAVLAEQPDRQVAAELGLSRQTICTDVRRMAAELVAEIMTATLEASSLQPAPRPARPRSEQP